MIARMILTHSLCFSSTRYCDCFANGEFCNNCNCNNCFNNLEHETERLKAIKVKNKNKKYNKKKMERVI